MCDTSNLANLDLLEHQAVLAYEATRLLPTRQASYDVALELLQQATSPGRYYRAQEMLRDRLRALNELRRAAGQAEEPGPALLSLDELLAAA